jgi:ribonuclease HI
MTHHDVIRQEFRTLYAELGLRGPEYDHVIVADGSGTKATTPCGYYAALHSWKSDEVREFVGAVSHGTNNRAELSPVLEALAWLDLNGVAGRRVLCVSDSEITVKGAKREYGRNANQHLWAALDYFERVGFKMSFRWVPRNSHEIHRRADARSRAGRLAMEQHLAGDIDSPGGKL